MSNRFRQIVSEKSNEELLVMVYEFADWDAEMLSAVEAELKNRQLLPEDIATRKQELVEAEDAALLKGSEASLAGQIFGWLGVLGILGLIIGYHYAFSKVRSKYTQKVYDKYDADSRENGSYIFYTALTVFILTIVYTVLKFSGSMI